MPRYKSKYGVVYEIAVNGESHLLCKIHTDVKMLRRKEVVTERKESFLRASEADCLTYLYEIDTFEENIYLNNS